MRIFYFDRTGGACDYYRATLPLTTAAILHPDKVELGTLTKADLIVAIESDNHTKINKLLEADVIVIPRLAELSFYNRIRELNPRAKIVLEYDDDLFHVSPLSTHYVDHGLENVTMQFPDGKTLDVWTDGLNIDLAKNRSMMDDVKTVLSLADLVTVTTPILADAYKTYAKNVVALPNCIDLDLWKRLPLKSREDVRMGWFGGASHFEDWTLLTDVLPKVMEQFKYLKLVIMGQKFDGTLKDLPKDRVEFHPWVPTQAYPYKAAILDLDFAVIPLRDTTFNRCKSSIKWVEMGALEIPSVTSYVSPYKEHANEGNGVYIDGNGVQEWIVGISLLAQNPKMRSEIGAEAHRTVIENFDIKSKAHLWAEAYEGVLNGVPNTADLVGNRS